MKSNFDFLKDTDKELFLLIEEAQRLFLDEYLNQAVIQLRIFAEKTAEKIYGEQNSINMSFDDILNCLKDRIKTEQEREFIEDLFFIKKFGNKAAHGEDILSKDVLEAFERAFEAAINYSFAKKKDEKILKLRFDKTLLISGIPEKKFNLADKYTALAKQNAKILLGLKDDTVNSDSEILQYEKKQEKIKKERIKENIKKTRKKISQDINKTPKKTSKNKKNNKKNLLKMFLFLLIVTISLFFLTKMIFFF